MSSQHLFGLTLVFGMLALIYPIFVSGAPDVPQASFVADGWPRIRKFWMQPTQFVWGRVAPLGNGARLLRPVAMRWTFNSRNASMSLSQSSLVSALIRTSAMERRRTSSYYTFE